MVQGSSQPDYQIKYEQVDDLSVKLFNNLSEVKDGSNYYRFVGVNETQLNLAEEDYSNTDNWQIIDPAPSWSETDASLNRFLQITKTAVLKGMNGQLAVVG